MPEHSENATENIMSSIMETISDNPPKQKSVRFDEGSISNQARLLGGQKSVHHILSGGKSADVLLWRNKKISSSVLALATAAWVFFSSGNTERSWPAGHRSVLSQLYMQTPAPASLLQN